MAAKCVAFYVDVVDNGFLISTEEGLEPKAALVFTSDKDVTMYISTVLRRVHQGLHNKEGLSE